MDYPLDADIYQLMDQVHGKTFSDDLEEQMEISELLYGMNLKFSFSQKDIDRILALDMKSGSDNPAAKYSLEIRERVRTILYEQMRKYPYLFRYQE